jgi:hypothetical protein
MCTVLLPPGGYPIAVNIYRIIYAEKLPAKISNSMIYKDNFRPVTVKVGKSDLEEVDPSSGDGDDDDDD